MTARRRCSAGPAGAPRAHSGFDERPLRLFEVDAQAQHRTLAPGWTIQLTHWAALEATSELAMSADPLVNGNRLFDCASSRPAPAAARWATPITEPPAGQPSSEHWPVGDEEEFFGGAWSWQARHGRHADGWRPPWAKRPGAKHTSQRAISASFSYN